MQQKNNYVLLMLKQNPFFQAYFFLRAYCLNTNCFTSSVITLLLSLLCFARTHFTMWKMHFKVILLGAVTEKNKGMLNFYK